MRTFKRLIYFLSIFIMVISMAGMLSAQPNQAELNVFDLPSITHSVVAEGQGYFPVLNHVGNRMFAVFRSGGGHLGQGGLLVYSWCGDGQGIQWSMPATIVDSASDDRNPAVGITDTGRIVLAYHEQGSYTDDGRYDPSLKRSRPMYTYSDDEGQTWAKPKFVNIPGLETCSPYGRIVSATGGVLLMNLYGAYTTKVPGMEYVRPDRKNYAYLVRSTDNGASWGDPSLIADGYNETALLSVEGATVLAAARSIGLQRVDECESLDVGRTWTNPLRITGPGQHPADLLRLSNGWILLLYGDRQADDKMIHGVITRDGGRTWDINNDIIFSRPVRGDFGYPSAVRLPNGKIVVMYYWAGPAENSYDGSKARAYVNSFDEAEFVNAYMETFDINPSTP